MNYSSKIDWSLFDRSDDGQFALSFPEIPSKSTQYAARAATGVRQNDRAVLEKFLNALCAPDSQAAADALFKEFGSMSDMFSGSHWRLTKAVGSTLASAINASRELVKAILTEQVTDRPIIAGSKALLNFLRLDMAFFERERLIALYLDVQCRLIQIVNLAEGTASDVSIDHGRIIQEGLNLGASGFLLVHNHPSGDPCPSRADREFTARLALIADSLEMPLIDHIIVAKGKAWSFNGFLRPE